MAKVLSWGSLAGMLVCLIVMICVALLQYDYEIRSFNTIDRSVLRRVRNDADVMDSSVAWDCDRPWPRHAIFLTLYVPPRGTNGTATHHSWNPADLPEWYDIFLRGVLLFWPWQRAKTPLVIMIDAEMKGTPELKEEVLDVIDAGRNEFGSLFPSTRVIYNDALNGTYRNGYGRMQYLGFMADKYIEEDYIFFFDSDAFLHSYADREDFWENGKPIISGRLSHTNYALFFKKTFDAIGKEEIMSCMSYFPIVIKRSHLAPIREAIREYRNKSTFEEAYYDFTFTNPGAQFNIMCTWLFLNKRDEYAWRLKDLEPEWDGFHRPKPRPGMWADKSIFKREEMKFTVPYLSEHVTYGRLMRSDGSFIYGSQLSRRILESLLLTSLCYLETQKPHTFIVASNATELGKWTYSAYQSFCPDFVKKNYYHDEWWRFEASDFKDVVDEEQKQLMKLGRLQRLKTCNHTYMIV